MNEIITEKIKLWGIVQGVGFRPFVAKIADRLKIRGDVLNIGGLVEIRLTDTRSRIDEFIDVLQREKPKPAEIVHIQRREIDSVDFSDFSILRSDEGDEEAAMIPADLSICPSCLAEMKDPANPRHDHPFISCMVCGPRYTIIDRIPYDRENTAMIEFPMCDYCNGQYTDLDDRRYHAQTISCHDCGPYLKLRTRDGGDMLQSRNEREKGICEKAGERISDKEILETACTILKDGGVIAFKSMGGYNLVADPLSAKAVDALRQIKKRERKPFAVMFENSQEIRKYCHMDEVEETLLCSSAKPIMLLEHRALDELRAQLTRSLDREPGRDIDVGEFADSRFIGSFLPSMGAQHMLLAMFGSPLIVTSANLSGMPIIKDDEQMFALMEEEQLIEAAVYNERDIRVSVDDSVVRAIDGQPQIIRRSKGYAPVPLYINVGSCDSSQMLAAGGQLKNSFALTKGPFAYMSQYFGDMDSEENQKIYEDNIERMAQLFRIKPGKVICDLHPLYYTTAFAERYAEENDLPLIKVQHHHAHVASVMAEHDLDETVIGISFDGTGYGTDGAIWGGEILLCRGSRFERKAHLKYVKMLGGDSSMKEGWKSALSYQHAYANGYLQQCAEDEIVIDLTEILEYAESSGWRKAGSAASVDQSKYEIAAKAIAHDINTIESSSMGRLFDGVAAMLGIKEYNDYEGQCAIMLEDAAAAFMRGDSASRTDELAFRFHMQIAEMILQQCEKVRCDSDFRCVALTGGVFQNKILMEESVKLLRGKGFEPYYNISVSPNDGGIALGQAWIGLKEEEEHGNR